VYDSLNPDHIFFYPEEDYLTAIGRDPDITPKIRPQTVKMRISCNSNDLLPQLTHERNSTCRIADRDPIGDRLQVGLNVIREFNPHLACVSLAFRKRLVFPLQAIEDFFE
jgi:hypothetical protein